MRKKITIVLIVFAAAIAYLAALTIIFLSIEDKNSQPSKQLTSIAEPNDRDMNLINSPPEEKVVQGN